MDGTGKTLDRNRRAVSRYIRLATLFRRGIEQGAWRTGQQIPTVDDLAAECGAARATIRQALDQLQNEALIERFRAKGTLLRPRESAEIEILSDEPGRDGAGVPSSIGEPPPWRGGRSFLLADGYLDRP